MQRRDLLKLIGMGGLGAAVAKVASAPEPESTVMTGAEPLIDWTVEDPPGGRYSAFLYTCNGDCLPAFHGGVNGGMTDEERVHWRKQWERISEKITKQGVGI